MPRVTAKKVPAHDRWVCLGCRWSTKIALIDARATNRPSYKCPRCAKRMLWTGTAFRPPRRDDDEGWLIAERILVAGHRFRATRNRGRFPRRLAEVVSLARGMGPRLARTMGPGDGHRRPGDLMPQI